MIRNFKMSPALTVLCAVSSPAALSAATSPQATALLAHSLAALSGGKAIQDVKAMGLQALGITDHELEGTVNYIAGSDEETGQGTLEAAGDLKSNVALNLTNGLREQIQNGQQAALVGANGQQQILPLEERRRLAQSGLSV
jgi:hypothetical protein